MTYLYMYLYYKSINCPDLLKCKLGSEPFAELGKFSLDLNIQSHLQTWLCGQDKPTPFHEITPTGLLGVPVGHPQLGNYLNVGDSVRGTCCMFALLVHLKDFCGCPQWTCLSSIHVSII
ncbi:hypothetical protein ILYODFUR_037106 [Ilyodon furcidens]|uniref:Uncharacterized protein n=1 Tax=Ilyodon furcidens TaxID=33524 RepID=A0ABV0UCU4_9TELE